eukprot:SAG11_NODE_1797_length_4246_cov_2.922354_1_plen_92_part_00
MPLHKDSRKKAAFKLANSVPFSTEWSLWGYFHQQHTFNGSVETKLERHGVLHRLVHPEAKNVNGAYFDPDDNTCVGFACVYIGLLSFGRRT